MKFSSIRKFFVCFVAGFLLLFFYVIVRKNNFELVLSLPRFGTENADFTRIKNVTNDIQGHDDGKFSNNSQINATTTTTTKLQAKEVSNVIAVENKTAKQEQMVEINENKNKMKYILQWTPRMHSPFLYMLQGQEVFINNKCKYTNCYVTSDISHLGDVTKFDVIAFNGPDLVHFHRNMLPQKRSQHQKYVFATIESPHYYPICDSVFDGYFNWTWTYKLDSDSKWGYFVVRDKDGNIIGPRKEMHWIKYEDMGPVPDDLMTVLKGKKKAAAWLVSNCYSRSKRENFVKELQVELKQFGLNIDIYGKCGVDCDNGEKKCEKLIEEDYYFYLAFENSFAEDYVTEKILHGLQHSALPIVFGGANYTRFVPDRSYINARELGVKKLAIRMNELIHNIEEYSSYFKWRNHYSFHRRVESPETDDYCGFCTILNDEKKVKEVKVYEKFRTWWNNVETSCKT